MVKPVLQACLWMATALLTATTTSAQTIEAARAAFAEGRFVEAAELAAALETSEGYALAAEWLAAYGYLIAAADDQPALFERAVVAAEEAIRLDPDNPAAHFQSAHAIGRSGEIVGVMEALNQGYARRARAALEEALRLDPQLGNAHLGLAGWHAHIVNRMGRMMANVAFRATRQDALAHYERALEMDPDEIFTYLEYAHGLLLLNRSRNREQARELLTRAIELPLQDALDRILHELAVQRLAALDAE